MTEEHSVRKSSPIPLSIAIGMELQHVRGGTCLIVRTVHLQVRDERTQSAVTEIHNYASDHSTVMMMSLMMGMYTYSTCN